MSTQDIVIIGTGIAGVTVAREVRKLDQDASITMITADDGTIYSKPMLSNAHALNKTLESLAQKNAEDFASDLNVTVRAHTRVADIDRAAKAVALDGPDGRAVLGYKNLVMATGATPRAYSVEGSDTAPLYSVNDLDDYTHWREALGREASQKHARVLIVGAGLIGSEFANDLTIAGHDVSMVDPAPWPLGRLLPERLGHAVHDALSESGIALHMGRTIKAMAQDGAGGWTAKLDDGARVHFDIALSAIGLVPNVALAKQAGLTVEQGVRVDAVMRTSDPAIYALGDCAQMDVGVLPYIAPVMTAARALAKTLTGEETPVHFPALPVTVKIPALACVVCPPPANVSGAWEVNGEGRDLKALYMGEDGRAAGFALTGAATQARQAMAKGMPSAMAA